MTWPGSGGVWSARRERGERADLNVGGGPACAWCEGPLGSSPSDYFCRHECAVQWGENDGWQAVS